ncbi:hypothetical protein EDC26_11845 [Paralcaligenes ureilyticus]|uniref:Uncharacterized protein n=1 Tax=Paralcaligenes ureilyticus TaxID=627131 RepID=A0A4R3LVR1_9BURK|nr:hypothetical protein EDC26_11845 [Paralcaligenes ureilyticus]
MSAAVRRGVRAVRCPDGLPVPKERRKGRYPHVVYLSRQALDTFVALHTCAAGSSMVDVWIDGQTYVPTLMPENVVVLMLSAMA